jgi:hypothetical protein
MQMMRPTRISLCLLGVLGLLAQLSCTNAAVDKAVGSATGASTIAVARNERGIAVENRVGRPLLNIRLAIEGGDNAATFIYSLPTLDTGATREIPFADFRTEDGALFEPGSATPKQVRATARDTLGNNHAVTLPWQ